MMRRWLISAILMAMATGWAFAQAAPQERTFSASTADVERALQDIHANAGGKLPILDGFVAPQQQALDQYQRGFYQYSITVSPISSTETKVRVSAKITAWHKAVSGPSGYEVMTSNGRLESDLLDNLNDALQPRAAGSASTAVTTPSTASSTLSAPNAPSTAHEASVFKSAPNPKPRPQAPSESAQDEANEQRIQQLTEEGNSLREILRNQSHPSNLAVIRAPRTPILEKPIDGSKVLLTADAEDEFQVVDAAGEWVHIQVSGISRGWVRRAEVDIPQGTTQTLSSMENDPRNYDRAPSFQQTREEISVFPGKWEPLDGKKVKIIWVQPAGKKTFGSEPKLNLVKSILKKAYPDVSSTTPPVAGVVVILDSEDGGMAAATMAALQQWHAGHLPDTAFWKRCWLDPAESFKDME